MLNKKFNQKNLKNTLQPVIAAILILAVFIQALIPLGFMPGNLVAGESFVTICPSQQATLYETITASSPTDNASHQHHHHHHGHDSDQTTDHNSSPQTCLWSAGTLTEQINTAHRTTILILASNTLFLQIQLSNPLLTIDKTSPIRAPPNPPIV